MTLVAWPIHRDSVRYYMCVVQVIEEPTERTLGEHVLRINFHNLRRWELHLKIWINCALFWIHRTFLKIYSWSPNIILGSVKWNHRVASGQWSGISCCWLLSSILQEICRSIGTILGISKRFTSATRRSSVLRQVFAEHQPLCFPPQTPWWAVESTRVFPGIKPPICHWRTSVPIGSWWFFPTCRACPPRTASAKADSTSSRAWLEDGSKTYQQRWWFNNLSKI